MKQMEFMIGRKVFHSPQVMGILNVTPDSFFAGSRKQTECEVTERVNQIIGEGASIIDVGGCSTRPGAAVATEAEEMQRVRFALDIISKTHTDALVSVDTFRPDVARMSVEEFGADIINDVSEGSEEMFRMVARLKTPYILMSVKPDIETMTEAFDREIAQLHELGHEDIILDPGYGFGKTLEQNYAVLKRQEELMKWKLPLLVGVSRKRMVWQHLGITPDEALNGTTAINMLALERGAAILRVHDVKAAVEAVKIKEIFDNAV